MVTTRTPIFELWTISDAGYNPNNLYRNSLARYFLPSVNEWYKAAYYDPTSGVYYNYPTGSDTAPTAVANGTAAGTAVYNRRRLQTALRISRIAGGLSPYGTMGQGGNVFEWEETDFDLVNGPIWFVCSRHSRRPWTAAPRLALFEPCPQLGDERTSLVFASQVSLSQARCSLAWPAWVCCCGDDVHFVPDPSTHETAGHQFLSIAWERLTPVPCHPRGFL